MADNTAYQDLLKDTSESKENGDYFLVTITDLNPNTIYPVQFKWIYNKNTVNGDWSSVRIINTPGESEPNTPKFSSNSVDVSQAEKIIITWDGTSDDPGNPVITNYDRVDVYIDGAPFDGTKAAYSFKSPGTAVLAAPAGTYQIVLYAVSKSGKLSPVSASVTKTVSAATIPVTSPETPYAPSIRAGLASLIVEWNGKKSDGTNLTTTGFSGAKVYVGTSSGFTPSADNWVHTLNFANGSNKVAIGVGTVINKTSGATLEYGTPYYVKIDTVNSNGTSNGSPIAATGNPVTVAKLPASEISTGILAADASITAGADGGARVVMSGASSPFIIYGTDGTTKLMEFIGGSTGTLAINGGGTFTGSLSIGSSNAIFKAVPATGIWLGDATYSSAPFSVSNNGVIKATSGTIGGWTLGSTYLQGSNIKLDTGGLTMGSTSSSYLDISSSAMTHRNSNGTASSKFTLDFSSGNLTLGGTIAAAANSTLGGWTSAASYLYGGNMRLGSDGSITTGAGGTNGNFSVNSSGDLAAISGTIGGSTLSNSTITGGTIQTSAGSAAVVLDGSTNAIKFKYGGSTTGSILPYSSYGVIMHYGATPDASGNSYPKVWVGSGNASLFADSSHGLGISSSGSFFTGSVQGDNVISCNISGSGYSAGDIVAARYLYTVGHTTTGSAANAYINSSTGLIARSAPSSQRYKDNIVNISQTSELDPKQLLNIKVRSFTYKDGYLPETDPRARIKLPGFIAEEVQEVYPIAVDLVNGQAETWNERYIIPGLVALVQDLYSEINQLKTRLDALKT